MSDARARVNFTITIASDARKSDIQALPPGFYLAALDVPTIDSSVIQLKAGQDPATMRDVVDSGNTLVTYGAADTGAKVKASPQAVKDASVAGFLQLNLVTTDQLANRVIAGYLQRLS